MKAVAGALQLEYETFGEPAARPLLLIMGLGSQMTAWPEGFCRALAARGFFVVRFDNRDVGLSTYFDDSPPPSLLDFALRRARAPYTLADMAADAVAVLDHLGIARAHVVGASMGGMIAQLVAVNHSDRVLSLTSIMSAVGGKDTVPASRGVFLPLLKRTPGDREGRIRRQLEIRRMLAAGHGFDPERERQAAEAAIDRAYHPAGTLRQLAAVVNAPSRRDDLGRLRLPALVIHGTADPLVPIENGRRTVAAIPGATWVEVPRMGHNLPPDAWPPVLDAIAELASRAETVPA